MTLLLQIADAAQDKIDRIVWEKKPGWKWRSIYETLKNRDREAWAIVGVVVGLILLVIVARHVTKKLLDD
jgi:hypothetical protein